MYIREDSGKWGFGVVSCIITEGWVHESSESCSNIILLMEIPNNHLGRICIILDGGFNCFFFSPLPGEMIQFH